MVRTPVAAVSWPPPGEMAHRLLTLFNSQNARRQCWGALLYASRSMSSGSRLAAIKALRERTGAPMSDVKASLEAAGFDQEAAFGDLRKRGLLAASKKSSRLAVEGLVGVVRGDGCIGVLEVNCETDFVARNEGFSRAIADAANAMLRVDRSAVRESMEVEIAALEEVQLPSTGVRLKDYIAELAGSMRENIQLRRGFLMYSPGHLYSYIHNPPPTSIGTLGKIAGIVSLESPSGPLSESMEAAVNADSLGYRLAMQVVGLKPRYLDRASIDAEHLEDEKRILRDQARQEKKPEAVIDKIVMGRLGKFFEDVCLFDQRYVMDDSLTVGKVIDTVAKKGGKPGDLKVGAFLRVQCGEGLESTENKSFSEEVAQMAGVA